MDKKEAEELKKKLFNQKENGWKSKSVGEYGRTPDSDRGKRCY